MDDCDPGSAAAQSLPPVSLRSISSCSARQPARHHPRPAPARRRGGLCSGEKGGAKWAAHTGKGFKERDSVGPFHTIAPGVVHRLACGCAPRPRPQPPCSCRLPLRRLSNAGRPAAESRPARQCVQPRSQRAEEEEHGRGISRGQKLLGGQVYAQYYTARRGYGRQSLGVFTV